MPETTVSEAISIFLQDTSAKTGSILIPDSDFSEKYILSTGFSAVTGQ